MYKRRVFSCCSCQPGPAGSVPVGRGGGWGTQVPRSVLWDGGTLL